MRTVQTVRTVHTVQTVQLFRLLFLKVCTPFSYSFGSIGTVSNFWTLHEEILLSRVGKTKSRGQVSRAHAD